MPLYGFCARLIGQNGVPAKITIDKSGTNSAAIPSYNLEQDAEIELR
jgi:putative transposase